MKTEIRTRRNSNSNEMQHMDSHRFQDEDELPSDSFEDSDVEDSSKIQNCPLPEIPMATDHTYDEVQYLTKNVLTKLHKTETRIKSFPHREIIIGGDKNFKRINITNASCKVKLEKKHCYRRDVSSK